MATSPNQPVLLKIVYDPVEHDLAILGKHYLLTDGNFFVIAVENTTRMDARQLTPKIYNYYNPKEALKIFQRECLDNPQIQGM